MILNIYITLFYYYTSTQLLNYRSGYSQNFISCLIHKLCETYGHHTQPLKAERSKHSLYVRRKSPSRTGIELVKTAPY